MAVKNLTFTISKHSEGDYLFSCYNLELVVAGEKLKSYFNDRVVNEITLVGLVDFFNKIESNNECWVNVSCEEVVTCYDVCNVTNEDIEQVWVFIVDNIMFGYNEENLFSRYIKCASIKHARLGLPYF